MGLETGCTDEIIYPRSTINGIAATAMSSGGGGGRIGTAVDGTSTSVIIILEPLRVIWGSDRILR